jgi:ADP-ribosyl-[dinitrogen reductase] hydrolase
MDSSTNLTFESLAKGALFGALCGDAIGGVLEHKPVPNSKDINYAFSLPGGGHHKLGKGQVTDDGELTLCLLQGLADGKGVMNLNIIATYYGKWINSPPFDIGRTTRNSLPKASGMKEHQAEMVRRGAKLSADSQSNGCLMRISPLPIWGSKLKLEDLLKAVREESLLTHPNETCIISLGLCSCNSSFA